MSDQTLKQRARRIFMDLADLPPERRATAFDDACHGDSALRAEVEALIRAEADAGSFLNSPTASTAIRKSALTPITEKPGTRIGPYKLLQQIGEGGFGTVFLAEQEKPVRRRVALKIIKLGMDTRQVIARFEAERQALALMDHPHIARVLDGGATESGRPYFVMEYVTGDPINIFADSRKLGLPQRLELFQQVCSAVQHAHTKGIIHRDLKPGNIVVSMVDGKPFAKVIDFGIAKATGAVGALTEKTLFTEHRQLIGTPEYMSPEQAEGLPDIDTRADIYALGVLLYELLTGLTPFDAKRLRSAAWGELQRIIREEDPPSPSLRLQKKLGSAGVPQVPGADDIANEQWNAGAPLAPGARPAAFTITQSPTHKSTGFAAASPDQLRGELDWIVMKALDKDRARRYETANQFADDIRRHLIGEPVTAAPPSTAYRIRKFVRRYRGAVITASAVCAALLLGIGGTTWGLWRARLANERIASQRDLAIEAVKSIGIAVAEAGQSSDGATPGELVYAAAVSNVYSREATYLTISRDGDGELIASLGQDDKTGDVLRDTQGLSQLPTPSLQAALSILEAFVRQVLATERQARRELEASIATLEESVLREQELRDAAEWSSYTSNLALAQNAITNHNWPEARRRLNAVPQPIIGWEYQLLMSEASSNQLGVESGGRGFLDPTGTHLIALGEDGSATRVISLADGLSRIVINTDCYPNTVCFGAGDLALAHHLDESVTWFIGTSDEPVPFIATLINFTSGRITRLPHSLGAFRSAEFSQDGSRVLTSVPDGTRLWSVDGDLIAQVLAPDTTNGRSHFSPDGATMVVLAGNSARLLANDGAVEIATMSHSAEIWDAAYSPDSSLVVTRSYDNSARLWNSTGQLIATLPHDQNVRSAEFSPDGLAVLTSSRDGTARLWNIDGQLVSTLRHMAPINVARFSPDGSLILTAADDGAARLWSRSGAPVGCTMRHSGAVTIADFSSDGELIATADDSTLSQVSLWDTSGCPQGRMQLDGAKCSNIMLSSNDYILIDGSLDQLGSYKHELRLTKRSEFCDVRYVLAGYEPTGSSLWAAWLTGDSQPNAPISNVAISPDNTRRVVATPDRTIKFYDTATDREVATFGVDSPCEKLQFTPDGGRLVLWLADGSIHVWDARPFEERKADLVARWRAQQEVEPWVDAILAGDTPDDDLERVIAEAETETPLRRLAALDTLRWKLSEIEHAASAKLSELKEQHITPERVRKAAALDSDGLIENPALSRRVLQAVLRGAGEWAPETVAPRAFDVLVDPEASGALLAAAMEGARLTTATSGEWVGANEALAFSEYRLGNYERAIEILEPGMNLDRRMWDKYTFWTIAGTAMAEAKLGRLNAARDTIQILEDLRIKLVSGDQTYDAALAEAQSVLAEAEKNAARRTEGADAGDSSP